MFFNSSSVSTVAGLHDVAAAAGGLTLNDRTISGTMPAIMTARSPAAPSGSA